MRVWGDVRSLSLSGLLHPMLKLARPANHRVRNRANAAVLILASFGVN